MERLATSLRTTVGTVRTIVVFLVCLMYLDIVLALFPWTRPASQRVFRLVLDPLQGMALGFIDSLPRLAFLAVLVVVVRVLIRIQRSVFNAIRLGNIQFGTFDPDWAEPTYRISRMVTIAFALVVAYPYLPGSGTEAFKGISIFAGLVFSLASSSALANSIAGYALTYRRVYKVGDRVRIGEVFGDVRRIGAQVTHVQSTKNEEIIIPNSAVISSHVVNYTTLVRAHGLILHTTVGIGYETPWRQVEAMLILAASRTSGLMTEPPPFVHEKVLGDFAITYELNAYCDDAQRQMKLYSALHRNILDVFNEFGVQIMTPSYENDPEQPKLVPKEKWFETPATFGSPIGPTRNPVGAEE
jgi:small-conductance mechanosensitive channel